MPKTTYLIEFVYGPWCGMVADVRCRNIPTRIGKDWLNNHRPDRLNDNVPLIRSNYLDRNPIYLRERTEFGVELYVFGGYEG